MEEGHIPYKAAECLSPSLIERVFQNDPSLVALKIIRRPLAESTFSNEIALRKEEEELLWSLADALFHNNTILTSLSFTDMHFGNRSMIKSRN